jgi:hypothetical protein
VLRLDFKRGDESVFGVDDHMLGFGLQLESDSELQGEHSYLRSVYHGCAVTAVPMHADRIGREGLIAKARGKPEKAKAALKNSTEVRLASGS